MPTSAIQKIKEQYNEYPDDIFKETRMPLGEHIEELRRRMFRAIGWLVLFLVIGFFLDALGGLVGNENIGIGRPVMKFITAPVESQARDFYYRRAMKLEEEKIANIVRTEPEEVTRIREKLKRHDNDLSALTADERRKLLGSPRPLKGWVDPKLFEPAFGPPKPGAPAELQVTLLVYPAEISSMSETGIAMTDGKQYISTLSAQEAFIVYFKVSLLCGLVLGSPFIFYQFWAFVAAGLYPHEKKYVYMFFGPSVALFIFGVVFCEIMVLPSAVKALLAFNEILGFDPDIRLNEWLGLAIVLPLVFGISFQTPLVMVFMNRIGLFSAQDYLAKWRYACFILALVAAIITPTPDAITMMYMFVPMFGMYMAGVVFCYWFPGFDPNEVEEEEPAQEVAV